MPPSPSQFWPEQTRRSRAPVTPLLPTPPSTQPFPTPSNLASTAADLAEAHLPPIRDSQAPAKRSFTAYQNEAVQSTLLSPPSSQSRTYAPLRQTPVSPPRFTPTNFSRFYTSIEDNDEEEHTPEWLTQEAERQRRREIARGKRMADTVAQAQRDGYLGKAERRRGCARRLKVD
jgi:hypothetical protein